MLLIKGASAFRMWKALVTAGFAFWLSVCQAYAFERGKSVRLNTDELDDIKESVAWDLRQNHIVRSDSPDDIRFGKIAAAQNSKGITVLCGYLRLKESGGAYSEEMLFMGILARYPSRLHSDRVLTSALARGAQDVSVLRSRCEMLGVVI